MNHRTYIITKIIDGDSIEVNYKTKIRIANVDVIGPSANQAAVKYLKRHWLYRKVQLMDDPNQINKVVHGELVKIVISNGINLSEKLLKFGIRLKF